MRQSSHRSAVSLAAVALLLAACGGPVEVDVPELTKSEESMCDALTAALPDSVAEQARTEIEPSDAPAAAYGDPAIVVTCGVPEPKGFDLTAACEVADGVGFYIPDEQYVDQGLDVTVTAAGYMPRVQARIPAKYRPNAVAAAMSVLAPLVKAHLTLVEPCD